jgi:alpha-L-rhamnosidase
LRYQVCEGAGLNALFYRALRDAAWLGEIIGESSEAKAFAADADRLHADFNTLLWSSQDGSYYGGLFGPGSRTAERLDGRMFTGPFVDGHYQSTAQAALFALYSGIVPAERLNQVRSWVLAHLDQVTGPMSHYYLFHALYRIEDEKQDQRALDIMRAGWKLQIESPWQTAWEELNDGGGSKAHMYGAAPGAYLTTHVLGARRVGPVTGREILIEPRCGGLKWARGTAVTEFGPVEMNWSTGADGAIAIECSTPPETTATVRFFKREGKSSISVDGRPHTAKANGNFVEIAISPGAHKIQYPG